MRIKINSRSLSVLFGVGLFAVGPAVPAQAGWFSHAFHTVSHTVSHASHQVSDAAKRRAAEVKRRLEEEKRRAARLAREKAAEAKRKLEEERRAAAAAAARAKAEAERKAAEEKRRIAAAAARARAEAKREAALAAKKARESAARAAAETNRALVEAKKIGELALKDLVKFANNCGNIVAAMGRKSGVALPLPGQPMPYAMTSAGGGFANKQCNYEYQAGEICGAIPYVKTIVDAVKTAGPAGKAMAHGIHHAANSFPCKDIPITSERAQCAVIVGTARLGVKGAKCAGGVFSKLWNSRSGGGGMTQKKVNEICRAGGEFAFATGVDIAIAETGAGVAIEVGQIIKIAQKIRTILGSTAKINRNFGREVLACRL